MAAATLTMGLELDIWTGADTTVVQINGSADVSNAGEIAKGLLGVTARRTKIVVLDLSDLTFLSSLALGVLVEFRRGIVRCGGEVRVVGASRNVWDVFQRTGLDVWFDAEPNMQRLDR